MKKMPRCARCTEKKCRTGEDCFGLADEVKKLYDDEQIRKLHRAATAIEGRHYCREHRLRETILFAREMGYRKIGLAFCIGLADEAKIIDEILRQDFEVYSVCCKNCAIDKKIFGMEQIDDDLVEYMCNPAGQAELLNRADSEFNLICGLCVGHDAVFTQLSRAPVSTLIAKDRVLAHNPVGAIYCQYIRRNLIA